MGEIRVSDDAEDEERHPTRLLDGVVELHVDEDRSPMVVVSEDAPFTRQDVVLGNGGPAPPEAEELELRWAVLALSSVLAVVAVGLDAAGVLAAPGSSTVAVAGTLLRGLVFLAGAYGTFSLYTDARFLSRDEKNWSPSPWPYLLPGGVVVGAYLLWQLSATEPAALSVPALVGVALVAAALSAVPTGPIYLYNRHRTIGLFAE